MPEKPSSSGNNDNAPQKDYLGRILIGFILLAAVFWLLTYLL